jgi:pimeloyl-ACP methyl ester carboxylesterase
MYVISAAVLVAGLFLVYRWSRQRSIANAGALKGPNAIEESAFVRIGGIDQWIQIRGEDARNPVLLVLHGGPGVSYIPFGYLFRSWERYFTVVQWDQRGAGKTFGRNKKSALSIDSLVSDGIAVAEFLRDRLAKNRIVLFAHSWGCILGVRMASQRPDLFDAYFGVGQIVHMVESEIESYRMLEERLTRSGDLKALMALHKSGQPPYRDIKSWMVKQRLIVMTSPPPVTGELPDLFTASLFTPGYSLKDSFDWMSAFSKTVQKLYEEMLHRDARLDANTFDVPVFVFQGDEDMQAPLPSVKGYFEGLSAPEKELVVLEGEGHLTLLSNPDRVLELIRERLHS